jgi:hypothetical protein
MEKGDHNQFARILGVDPSTKGFAFVVLEANGRPVDWGIKELSAKGKRVDRELLRRLDPIIERYDPVVIALEDCQDGARGERALRMIETIAGHAALLDRQRQFFTRDEMRFILGLQESATKHEIALKVTECLPALQGYLPSKRRLGYSESESMNIFDAAALAVGTMLLKFPDRLTA